MTPQSEIRSEMCIGWGLAVLFTNGAKTFSFVNENLQKRAHARLLPKCGRNKTAATRNMPIICACYLF